jgi:hypothetical protein
MDKNQLIEALAWLMENPSESIAVASRLLMSQTVHCGRQLLGLQILKLIMEATTKSYQMLKS